MGQAAGSHRIDRERAIVAAALAIALLIVLAYPFGLFTRLNHFASDLLSRTLAAPPARAGDVVYLLITDETLVEADEVDGISWPWPRQAYGEAIRFLSRAGARAIVFDITFSETSGYGEGDDVALAEQLAGGPVVLPSLSSAKAGGLGTARQAEAAQRLQSFALSAANDGGVTVPRMVQLRPPVAALAGAASAVGDVKFLPDEDGVGRRFYPLVAHQGRYYPALSLAAALRVLGAAEISLSGATLRLDGAGYTREIPLDETGAAWLHYYGDSSVNPKYLLLRVIKSQIALDNGQPPHYDPALFRDKVVVIASDATELKDMRPNPIKPANDVGAHYHGTAIANLLNGDFLVPRVAPLFALPVVLVLGAFAAWCALRFGGLRGAALPLAALLLYWIAAAFLFRFHNTVIDLAAGTTALLLTSMVAALINYLYEARQKLFVTSAFGQYLSPKVVSGLLEDPTRLRLGGETRVMTAFFSDIKGFSSISERLTPEALVALLNDYLSEMCDVIGALDGTIDKFEGDAIMAFWGAPVPLESHAVNGCKAALEMQRRLVAMRARLAAEGRPEIVVRMGLNSGPMVVGNMGSRTKLNYTVMGDAVNLASRLEGANKFYGTPIAISEFTRELARGAIEVRELDIIRVMGKNEPIRIYELLAETGGLTTAQQRGVELFEEGLRRYRAQSFAEAMTLFEGVDGHLPGDPPSRIYRERCAQFMLQPPPREWDGVFTATAKG